MAPFKYCVICLVFFIAVRSAFEIPNPEDLSAGDESEAQSMGEGIGDAAKMREDETADDENIKMAEDKIFANLVDDGDAAKEKPAADDAAKEEPATDDAAKEEPATDDAAKEEPATDDAAKEKTDVDEAEEKIKAELNGSKNIGFSALMFCSTLIITILLNW